MGTENSFHLRQWLRDGALDLMASQDVWSWCDDDVPKRAWYVATFVPCPSMGPDAGRQWWRDLLARYGEREDVRRNLSANYATEGWSGPGSVHFSTKLESLLEMAKAEQNANVRLWLNEEIAHQEARIEAERIEEERAW